MRQIWTYTGKAIRELNAILRKEKQLLITNDYISNALDIIEETWFERQDQ
jgi:hypothetical protein